MSVAIEREVVIYLSPKIFIKLAHDLDPTIKPDQLPEVIVIRVKEDETGRHQ